MLSHIYYKNIDPEWPASLSPAIAGDLLRNRMGFENLVITDDLDMGAIKKHFEIRTAIKQILMADIDIVLICHEGPDMQTSFDEIARGMTQSPVIWEKGREAAGRIIRLKNEYLI